MAALRFKPILSAGMRVQAVFKQNFIARWRETTIRYLVVLGFSLVQVAVILTDLRSLKRALKKLVLLRFVINISKNFCVKVMKKIAVVHRDK